MKIIQQGRGGGKTHEIVNAFRRHTGDARLIVASVIERERIVRLYNLTQQEQQRVVVARQDCLRGHHGEMFCDNADWVLSLFLGESVDVATVNSAAPRPQEDQ